MTRRAMSSKLSPPKPSSSASEHTHDHSSHSHSLFHSHAGHSHPHNPSASPDSLFRAFTGRGDRGSNITLLGLASNVGLTVAKVGAGWKYNSASLLAEAGHSASDLLGDFVTLFCYNMSRRPPSKLFPYGFAKFDTVGMLSVSALLIVGSIGIGLHSYHLLTMLSFSDANPLAHLPHLPSFLPDAAHAGHSHGAPVVDATTGALDPNAAWTAAGSVVIKEALYRMTKKIGEETRSSVLEANALHHRSDALTSFVALLSILGSAAGAPILDPLGGLFVSAVLLVQSGRMAGESLVGLLDGAADEQVLGQAREVAEAEAESSSSSSSAATSEEGEWAVGRVRGIGGGGGGARVELVLGWTRASRISLATARGIGERVKARVEALDGVREATILYVEVDSLDELREPPPLLPGDDHATSASKAHSHEHEHDHEGHSHGEHKKDL